MRETIMIGICTVLALGMLAQWISWKYRFPSILLLLTFGFIAGPITGLLDPDTLLGDLLLPFVSLSVGLILFEGGLTLRFKELPGLRRVIFSLISLGMLATWFLASWAAISFLHMDTALAVLLGAILTVSGPTVIVPLLRDIRPKPHLSSVLKWEGILIDPVGATVAVLVFEAIVLGEFNQATSHIVWGVFKTAAVGGATGFLAALLLIMLIKRYLLPDYLQNPVSLTIVILSFVISDHFQHESGLLAVTLMGIVLANWPGINVRPIVEFKENLQVLLIGVLFILLSARLQPEQLASLGWESFLFLGFIVLVARPVAVFVSTVGSELKWTERAFLAWVAPRGIVAAAVASLFAIELSEAGYPGAELLVSYTFLIIIGAGLIYGLTAGPIAGLLSCKQGPPQGVLFLGANPFARALAQKLKKENFRVLLVDTNWNNVSLAKLGGLPTFYGNILSEKLAEELDLDGIGRLFALTPNNEANALAALRFSEHFGRAKVYQLAADSDVDSGALPAHPKHLRGRYLFGGDQTYDLLAQQFADGAEIRSLEISEKYSFEDAEKEFSILFTPLVVVRDLDSFDVISLDQQFRPKNGQKVIALVKGKDSSPKNGSEG